MRNVVRNRAVVWASHRRSCKYPIVRIRIPNGIFGGIMARQVLVSVASATLMFILASTAWNQSPAFTATQARSQEIAPREKDEISAMRSDLQKMRVLLNQMQTNLAFVQ